jgi:hypothetical protein
MNVRLMDRLRFQMMTAEAIDRHAKALQALMDRQNAYGEFLADLSVRLDALDARLREPTPTDDRHGRSE